jgi:hypothetical protein
MGRGIERKKIFANDRDRNDFIRRNVAKARGSISWIAVRELGYSGADAARYLGVTDSCVTRFVASGQKPEVNDLIKNL